MSWLYRVLIIAACLSLTFAAACLNPVPAVPGTVMGEMEDVEITWSPDWVGSSQYWALIRTDFLVYDDETELPANNVEIEIGSSFSGVYLVPTGVINVEDCPSDDSQWGDYCSDPNQTWAELTGDYNDALRPNYYKGYTDAQGIESIWLWVEDMPVAGEEVGSVQIWATIGVDSIDFQIKPGA